MKRLIHFVFILMATIAFSACNHAKVYDEYAHTPIAGWEKNDTLSFEIPPMAVTGYYRQSLGLRTTGLISVYGIDTHREPDHLPCQ